MSLDILSYNIATEALDNSGNIGTRPSNTTSIQDGQIMVYSTSENKFIPQYPATSGSIARNITLISSTINNDITKCQIQFKNPKDEAGDLLKVKMFISYVEDLNLKNYQYMIDNSILLYKDDFSKTSEATITYDFPITDSNRGQTLYVVFFTEWNFTEVTRSSGVSFSRKLKDETPNDPITSFSSVQSIDKITLNWINPSGTNNIDFAKVIIIENESHSPININDGAKVYEGNQNTTVLNNKDKSKHYYYRAFVFDSSNNIQDNISQTTDIQMDNKPPSPIDISKVTKSEGYGYIKVKWEETNLESDWKKTIVRISEGSPITSIEQGSEMIINTIRDYYKNNWFTKSGLVNGTKYYINFATVDNFDNVSSITYIDATPVASALNEVSNLQATNIENGTKIHLSWTNPMSMASATFNGRVIFYNKTEDLEGKNYDYCSTNATVLGIATGAGTGSGATETFDLTSVTIGEHYNFRAFARYDISGTNYYSSGTSISNFLVKDETPCLDYSNISFIGYDGMARLKYTDPTDLDWSKTIVILSKNGYISDENSTSIDIIQKITSTTRNEYSTNTLQFNSLINCTQYYVSLFSYDTSNNVNKNIVNRATVIPSAISVANPILFTTISNETGTQINLSWTNANGNYTAREIYGSTIDITGLTQAECQSGGYLLNSGVGTGSGIADSYVHVGVTYNTQYYYKIFTKYTYNSVDYCSNGISSTTKPLDTQAPLDLVSFIATPKDSEIDLTWNFNSSDIDIQKIVIVRNTTSNPTNETDGIVIVNSNITNYNDIGLTNGTTYYYRAFIYDIHGNVNVNDVSNNKVNKIPSIPVIEYGINWNKSTDVVTRLGNAIGKTAIMDGTNDFNSLYPWNGMKRCNLSDGGIVNAYYGDVTYKTDGTNGQCMVEIPKFYYKVINVDANNIQFWISDILSNGYEVHPAFFRCRDKLCDDQTGVAIEVDKRYYHTYIPYLNDTKLESKSGVSPYVNVAIGNGRTYAKNRGNGWGLVDFNLRYAIQLLYLIEYASFNSQAKIGRGFVDGNTSSHITGGTNNYGNNSYGETTGKVQMSYRGIEDFYGNCYQWLDGFYYDSSLNIMIGNKGFNNYGTGYTKYITGNISTEISGYISDIFGEKTVGFIPKTCSGSATTKLYDTGYLYANNLAVTGGHWSRASESGIFYFYCYSASMYNQYFSASLAY